MTEIAIREANGIAHHQAANTGALSVTNDQQAFTAAQLEAFGIANARRGEQLLFLHTVQRTGLDPAARQIYMISRGSKWTIQTGIDGFRLIARRAADRARHTISYDDTEWCDAQGKWTDVWLTSEAPTAARVRVYRNGERFSGTAMFREFKQAAGDMWTKMGANQIAKCAEAQALRKAFPQELAGIYTDDEMGHLDPSTGHAQPQAPRYGRVREEPVIAVVATPSSAFQQSQIVDLMNDANMSDAARPALVAKAIGRPAPDLPELTADEADRVIAALRDIIEPPPAAGTLPIGEPSA